MKSIFCSGNFVVYYILACMTGVKKGGRRGTNECVAGVRRGGREAKPYHGANYIYFVGFAGVHDQLLRERIVNT